ncbi:hypothetical protein D0439_04385 [Lysinibacillus fusiformis]|uniref:hypothetical protein n=1 Tax=Lysinibacillus fusiformis TaxID=28031 RepID=UPI0011BB22EF|nr:hypothetical protein [Lysinibacillus fusiformis]QDZ97905.1 hypothetical protein D0439_04385 [Lysinibacillus fusiformis]
MLNIPVIPESKNYWLVRTNGGKYYSEYKYDGFIGINWNAISIQDIKNLSYNELSAKIKEDYPDKKKPGRATSQLRIFDSLIKKGDAVVITNYASNKFLIGEVLEDTVFSVTIDEKKLEENPKLCVYEKRKKVRWIKEVHKWDVDKPMFKLLQHARNTINDANAYGDIIESLLHDFFVKGENAYFSLKVKRESNIPANDFFKMGSEILDLIDEFGKYKKDTSISSEGIITKVNVNSEGNAKFIGPVLKVAAAAYIVVICLTGGGFTFTLPEAVGGAEIDLHTNGLLREVSDFLDAKQEREQRDLLLSKYMDHLEIEAPDELKGLLEAVENQSSDNSSE